MTFLADENIPLEVVRQLREKGISILTLTQIARGSKDKEVIERAAKDNCIILTFDKDFGELVFRYRIKTYGIILLRITPRNPEYIADIIVKVLQDENLTLKGNFCVISDTKVRLIPLKQ